jgi:ribosomal protein S3
MCENALNKCAKRHKYAKCATKALECYMCEKAKGCSMSCSIENT